MAEVPCSMAGSMFRRETRVVRRCLDTGRWGEPDLTTCTLQASTEPFLLIAFVLDVNGTGSDDGQQMLLPGANGFSADGTPNEPTRRLLETEV